MVDGTAPDVTLLDPRRRPTLSVKEAAVLLGIAPHTVYDAVNRGELPVICIGRRKLVPTAALMAMVGLRATEPTAADATP
jgi:excisionase family DNA binding protein